MGKRPAQFTIPQASLDALSDLAEAEGVTRSELVRHALDVYKYLRDQKDRGGDIRVQMPDGEVLHLVRL